jgi:antitoxin component of MazEF toxin-antitoxin module
MSTIIQIPNKVLKKRKIKNMDEFYVVKEAVDDLSYQISDNDRKELYKLLAEYENNYKIKK